MTGRNPWAVLGLAEDASYEDVQRAYRGKVKQTHPDRGGAASDFRAVANAVEDLRRLHPQRPAATVPSQYDRWLRPHRPKGSQADYGRPAHRGSCRSGRRSGNAHQSIREEGLRSAPSARNGGNDEGNDRVRGRLILVTTHLPGGTIRLEGQSHP